MKRSNRKLLFPVVLLSLFLVACGGKGPESETGPDRAGSDSVEAVSEVPTAPLDLVADGVCRYTIIYPEGADSGLMEEIHRLSATIRSATGCEPEKHDDFLASGESAGAYEILIGKTNRSESRVVAADLRIGEFSVLAIGTRLVVCGADTDGTKQAVNRLIGIVEQNATDGTFRFEKKDCYRKTGTYYISSLSVNGVTIGKYRIVVPKTGYVEYYVALLLRQYIQAYAGFLTEVVTDDSTPYDYEILIGKTNRTEDAVPEAGEYLVRVTNNRLLALASSDTGYLGLLSAMKKEVFPNTKSRIEVTEGQSWSGTDNSVTVPGCAGSLRILYHNTWGYLNSDGSNPMANRSDLALTVYRAYMPDILCLEEAGPNWEQSSAALLAFLEGEYGELRFSAEGGAGNPIYYRTDKAELVQSGYRKSRNGDKGTTWGVFREKASGKLFAVTNSHFAADTNAGGDAELGERYRIQDATTVVEVTTEILDRYGEISVFSGGDFNCMVNSQPYTVLTGGGFTNLRETAEVSDTRSPYHGSFAYHAESGIYPLQSVLPYAANLAIDHIMTRGATATIHCYTVISDPIALTSSDHAPHYVDVTLGN